MIRLVCLKELMLTKPMVEVNVLFDITGSFLRKILDFNQKHERNGCHSLMQKYISFNKVATVSVKGTDYRIQFWYMSKDEAITLLENAELSKKVDYYKQKNILIM